ncbi:MULTISPECIES: hypothetical protein [unclassified Haladaptatus]|uniref:hypothetical protein n=1 Tax=unclassified Haladaptatus TaxID=2622732 RepID=UPI00209BBE4B|nr:MULTISPECIES: hypothetical protein [unclassified Haladaptatus]MCO8245999.1 hypothetical protein [Haladaptatus sp. AB643]MCO8254381.1 hypothetical protein [Haladaptatus sp. AB618]
MASNATTGFVGGLFSTVVMTAFRESISLSYPPTAEFCAKFLGGEPNDHPAGSIALHLLYGGFAGSLFAVAFGEGSNSALDTETEGIIGGLGYGLLLSLFGERVMLGRLLDMALEEDESMIFHAGHAMYGVALGAWVGSRS